MICRLLIKGFVITALLISPEVRLSAAEAADRRGDKEGAHQRQLREAKRIFDLARELDLQASAYLDKSHSIRQGVIQAREAHRGMKQQPEKKSFNQLISQYAVGIKDWQTEGKQSRRHSKMLYDMSQTLMTIGMQQTWPSIKANDVIMSATLRGKQLTQPHNASVRSAHPNMPSPSAPEEALSVSNNMTLKLPQMTGQSVPKELNISRFQYSSNGIYSAHIEVEHDMAYARHLIPLNTIHHWNLYVADAQGQPITDAEIDFTGHMPGHVHGLPTQPRITKMIKPGIYRVEGVKFQMQGWWVIDFLLQSKQAHIGSEGQSERVRFHLML